ncbi:hypothetical protein GCM10010967_48620 [Dyadobacter beijingensis]|uniref:YD repeat-containing protein n=2 Tax=Dyadobacter beijingensis TaxID=365489 RepID=A0ABQ2IE96_9BACT|nr:hypothetical protein GCM10010967_48620 [Dyadobacter beijingensis]
MPRDVNQWNYNPSIMKGNLLALLFATLWLACGSDDESIFGIEPALASYNDDAPALKKTYCGDSDCKTLSSEDRYTYDSQGKLSRIENFGRAAGGSWIPYQYSEFVYAPSGMLVSKTEYIKNNQNGWVRYTETEFEYEAGLLKVERSYNFPNSSGTKMPVRSTSYDYANGKKSGQRWYDVEGKLMYRVEYRYKNDVLSHETWYDASNKANRTFEHKFSGNRRQIGEYLTASRELLAMIEKSYDDQGRLLTQETKVNNPLLCALPPGKIQFTY